VSAVHLVVPGTVADPGHPSGGNVYDRELIRALRGRGVPVEEHAVPGAWPDNGDLSALGRTMAVVPDDAVVLMDGIIGLAAPDHLEAARHRVDTVLLVHLPLGLAAGSREVRTAEQRALTAAAGVITTSAWTRHWLLTTYALAPERVHIARPGVQKAPLSCGDSSGGALLCVGAVLPAKGQDVLVAALATVRELSWSCQVVGPLDRDPAFVRRLQSQIRHAGLEDRIRLAGALPHEAMTWAYQACDLLVLPTRLETYGMALTEALAHGVPAVASDTGGVSEALGGTACFGVPGLLVPPEEPEALAQTLREWLIDARCRQRWRTSAAVRRLQLADWSTTAERVQQAVHRAIAANRLNQTARATVL
jgi:glycosyltransferase involved in cell wall biosynthesis